MTIREARAAAVRRWWRDLQDDLSRGLPRLLDDLDTIDQAEITDRNSPGPLTATFDGMTPEQWAETRAAYDARFGESFLAGLGPLNEHLADGGTVEIEPPGPGPFAPTDAEISAWIEAHPAEFEKWVARQNRINGTTATQPSRQAGRRTPRSTKQT